MKVIKIKLQEEDFDKLQPEIKRLKIGLLVVEVYEESDEIQHKERALGISKQLTKDLNKELFELKFPKK